MCIDEAFASLKWKTALFLYMRQGGTMIRKSWSYRHFLLVLISVLLITVMCLCACGAPAPTQGLEYIETNFTVYADDTYRFNFFLNQGESFNCYWKASDYLQCWCTNSYGQAKLTKEVQIDPNSEEEILRIWEPGEITYPSEWKMEKMGWDRIDFTSMKEYYGVILEIVTTEGEFVQYEILNSGRAGDIQIKADRTGYYTLCFYVSHYDTESVDVVLRYWVVR